MLRGSIGGLRYATRIQRCAWYSTDHGAENLSPSIEALYEMNKAIRDGNVHISKKEGPGPVSASSLNRDFLEQLRREDEAEMKPRMEEVEQRKLQATDMSAATAKLTQRKKDSSATKTPKQLKELLDRYVVGQDACKKIMSVAVYNHCRRAKGNQRGKRLLQKSNVMLIGPSGSGKTLIAKTLADTLEIPFVIQDCTSLTQAGYVGEDVESCVMKLFAKSEYDQEKCEQGIIVLDEVDKLARRALSAGTKDIAGEGVQQALLKLIEGSPVTVQARTEEVEEEIVVDTSNILFIAMGAFVGLDKIVSQRLKGEVEERGNSQINNVVLEDGRRVSALRRVHAGDLVRFGLIPEFIGRLPVVATLDELDAGDLERVLTETKNSIVEQYKYIFGQEGVSLEITKGALHQIAELSLQNHTGARGLQSILSELLVPANFECPGGDYRGVLIDEEVVGEYIKSIEECTEFSPKYLKAV